MKKILTKKQAVSVLNCIEKEIEVDLFCPIEKNDKKLKLSLEELESKLAQYLSADTFAGVVDDEVEVSEAPRKKKWI